MHDIVIRGGQVVDGSGGPARTADVAIRNGLIVEVGRVSAPAGRVIDADGLLVTPGWIDIHTHYDGQATWDPMLDPSFSSGVTTAIMGNCGVGFAPVRRGFEDALIDLMDGVEEIPGTALHEGLTWDWSSFPEYLDRLDRMPRSLDVGALLPHGPLRLFVMGEHARERLRGTADELALMVRLVDEAMAAGAFGLSTSRTTNHRTVHGDMTPDFGVQLAELVALARPVAAHGGYVEIVPRGIGGEDPEGLKEDMRICEAMARHTGASLHVLMLQLDRDPAYWREQVGWAERINAKSVGRAYLQVGGRAVGLLLGFFGTHPFMDRATYKAIKELPRDRWLTELAKPEIRARILAEDDPPGTYGAFFNRFWDRTYDLGDPIDYEPDESRNLLRLAAAAGKIPAAFAYDKMLADGGNPRLLMALTNYNGGNFDSLREIILNDETVLALSDAGAHVMSICDGSLPTFMLTHWARDRSRGALLPIERVVREMTSNCARSIGLGDRGLIRPGLRADLNVIDFDALRMEAPSVVYDLPGGAGRLIQRISGYRATLVAGQITRENDQATGCLPGRLLRRPGMAARAQAGGMG